MGFQLYHAISMFLGVALEFDRFLGLSPASSFGFAPLLRRFGLTQAACLWVFGWVFLPAMCLRCRLASHSWKHRPSRSSPHTVGESSHEARWTLLFLACPVWPHCLPGRAQFSLVSLPGWSALVWPLFWYLASIFPFLYVLPSPLRHGCFPIVGFRVPTYDIAAHFKLDIRKPPCLAGWSWGFRLEKSQLSYHVDWLYPIQYHIISQLSSKNCWLYCWYKYNPWNVPA